MNNILEIAIMAGLAAFTLIFLGIILARLYRRSSKETAFVRTGMGGQKVIMNGGALVLPILHETIKVNMNTLRLGVERKNEAALITKDRLRVDVLAEFYLRVKPDIEAIANAAQTLGDRTLNPQMLKEMIEGKFVDALRSVAAELNMTDLHEKRAEFVQRVQQAVTEDLFKNGLELESVSLTGLDQTDKKYFNPDNVFDAQGLAIITEETQARLKRINDVEQETAVEIANKNREARERQLQIERDVRYAELEQRRELEVREAELAAHIAQQKAEQAKRAREAEIESNQSVEQHRIDAEREIEASEINKSRALREQEILKLKVVEIAEQDRRIAVAEKSREQSEADKAANEALALAVKAEEGVKTVRQIEEANRLKQIDIIAAQRTAEVEATEIKVRAEAEKSAAEDEADSIRLRASAEADSIKVKALADEVRFKVNAEGELAMNQALNVLSDAQIQLKRMLALYSTLPDVVEQSVKPLEQIDSIKIASIDGFGGLSNGTARDGNGGTSLADQVVNASLKHQALKPMVQSLLESAGISDLSDIPNMMNKIVSDAEEPNPAKTTSGDAQEQPKPDQSNDPEFEEVDSNNQ